MGSSAAAAAAAAAAADSAQWLSVKEETIFLHDGLIRVTDLAELPSEILGAPEAADTDLEVSEVAPPPRSPPPARQPRTSGVGLSPPCPEAPRAAGAGVCGRAAGRWGACGSAARPSPSLPARILRPAGDFIRGFVWNDPTPGILLDSHPAGPSRPGGASAASPVLPPLPHGPPDSLAGHTQVAQLWGHFNFNAAYLSPRSLSPVLC